MVACIWLTNQPINRGGVRFCGQLTDAALAPLAAALHADAGVALRELRLHGCFCVSDGALAALLGGLTRLRRVHLSDTLKLGPATLAALAGHSSRADARAWSA